jgi:site-specific recombinase XerC
MEVSAKMRERNRLFFSYLNNANSCCDSTISNIESAIRLWQEFTRNEDFALYNMDRAIAFKQCLLNRDRRGESISSLTYYSYLRYLRKFFRWLVREPAYKSRIKPNTIDYLE